jgi:hypothetical protein
MKLWRTGSCRRFVLSTLVAGGLILPTQAAWIGAGTAGGDPAATNFNDAANWQDGTINGDFRTIVSNVDLLLSTDYTATNGLDFGQTASVVRHITIGGTNTLSLNGKINYYSFNSGQATHIFLSSNSASTVTLKQGLTLSMPSSSAWYARGSGTLFIDAKVTGAGSLQTGTGSGNIYIVLRNGTNDFTNTISGDAGRILFTSIANTSVPSAAGMGGMDPNNFAISYIGSRSRSTNRSFTFNNSGTFFVNDSACGSLSMLGLVRPTQWGGNWMSPMNFDGVSSGELLVTNNLANGNSSFARLRKWGSGTLRLTGKNTFSCTNSNTYQVELLGGTLIADYTNDVTGAGSNRLFPAGHTVSFSDARLVIRGKSGAGNTTRQSFGTNTVADATMNALSIDGNGGDGTTAAWETLLMSGTNGLLRIEKSGNASFAVTNAFALDSGTVRPVNGVLMAASGARADILVKDPDGRVGFAAQNAALEIVRNTNAVELTASNGAASDHAALSSSLTRAAHLAVSTLTIDATTNDVTLDMAGYTFQTNGNAAGRGVAVYGGHAVAIQGGAHGAQTSTAIHNYTTDKLTWALTNGNCTYVSAGPGLTEFTQGLSNTLYIAEGTTRLTAARNYTEGTLYLFGNGVLEIGADLNGPAAGDFTRNVGTGAGQISFVSGGGFSAYGADRIVNLGGAGGAYAWASTLVPDGKPFILGSPYADATLIFANPIDLNERAREFRVQNGTAAIDARLTNRIYGNRTSALIKSGDGTLELKGPQAYRGDCSVIAGGLRLGADDVFAGGTNALVLSNATLDAGTYRNTFSTLEVLTNSVIEVVNGSAALAFADSSAKTWTGTLAVNGKLAATTLRFGTDGKGLTAAQIASIAKSGGSLYLDAQGYLRQKPMGTILFLD